MMSLITAREFLGVVGGSLVATLTAGRSLLPGRRVRPATVPYRIGADRYLVEVYPEPPAGIRPEDLTRAGDTWIALRYSPRSEWPELAGVPQPVPAEVRFWVEMDGVAHYIRDWAEEPTACRLCASCRGLYRAESSGVWSCTSDVAPVPGIDPPVEAPEPEPLPPIDPDEEAQLAAELAAEQRLLDAIDAFELNRAEADPDAAEQLSTVTVPALVSAIEDYPLDDGDEATVCFAEAGSSFDEWDNGIPSVVIDHRSGRVYWVPCETQVEVFEGAAVVQIG